MPMISLRLKLLECNIVIYFQLITHNVQDIHKRMVRLSKVNKKCISHLTLAQRTPPTAANVQVSRALITVLQFVHPWSHDTYPHGNQIRTILGVTCLL